MNINLLFEQVKEGRGELGDISGEEAVVDLSTVLETKTINYSLKNNTKILHVYLFIFITFLSICILLLRAIDLQVFKGGIYAQKSESNRTRRVTLQPDRGVIYDKNGEIIARNKPAFSVDLNTLECRASANDLSLCKKIVAEVGKILNTDFSSLAEKITPEANIVTLVSGLKKENIIELDTNLYKFPGLSISISPVREYLYPEAFSHVLGYVGLDDKSLQPVYVGKSGIEKTYDAYLSGVQGFEIIQIDSSGKKFELMAKVDSFPGKNVHTYLDTKLQIKAYELLKNLVEEKKATGGAVIAQDPETGGVIALVSYPSFDANKLTEGVPVKEYEEILKKENFPFFNRVVSATYPPGSTFKMVIASGALEEGNVSKSTSIFDPGYIQIGSFIFRNWKLSGHGDVNIVRALQVSNDTYFYSIGGGYGDIKGLGIESINKWALKFGFGSPTGIDIDGEASGYMPDGRSRQWYLGDTYITSIGQGDVLSTPLQVNNMAAYFANGGYLFKPSVVDYVDGEAEVENIVLNQHLISQENYEIIRQGMKAAVEAGGTAYPLFDFAQRHNGIELGGKTGTSEYIDPLGEEKTHAWLSVFGPFDNPNIVLTVFLEGGGGGSDDAGPVAKDLLDVWFGSNTR